MRVKVISRSGSSLLIEWVEQGGVLKRSRVPLNEVRTEEGVSVCDHPWEGIPYGEPWAELARTQLDSEKLEELLHRSGIWTIEDFDRDSVAVQDAFRTVYAMDAQKLREMVRMRNRGG